MKRLPISLLFALSGCAPTTSSQPTLCELAGHRGRYEGQPVTVEGYLMTSRHGSAISDPTCGSGVAIAVRMEDGPHRRELIRTMSQMDFELRIVRVRATGHIERNDHPALGPGLAWELQLSDAQIVETRALSRDDEIRYYRWLAGPSYEPFRTSR